MADVGRSTLEHVPEREAFYHETHDELENWGAWHRDIDEPMKRVACQPMFREYMAGYREVHSMRTQYDAERAAITDVSMATLLSRREIEVALCRYVFGMSSREAATRLTHIGYPCTHVKYTGWLDQVLAQMSMLQKLKMAW